MKSFLTIIILLFLFSCNKQFPKNKTYSCKYNNYGGITKIYSKDSIELGLATNQVWIFVRAQKEPNSKKFNLFFTEISDLGRGGMMIPWNNISKNKVIGSLFFISEDKILINFKGLYDSKKSKYINYPFDWDSCDTLYLNKK